MDDVHRSHRFSGLRHILRLLLVDQSYMKKGIIDFLKIVIGIALLVGAIFIVNNFLTAWGDMKDEERHERLEEFCDSFLEKDSTLYGRCMDSAVDYF